jgi:hypothetical protein
MGSMNLSLKKHILVREIKHGCKDCGGRQIHRASSGYSTGF